MSTHAPPRSLNIRHTVARHIDLQAARRRVHLSKQGRVALLQTPSHGIEGLGERPAELYEHVRAGQDGKEAVVDGGVTNDLLFEPVGPAFALSADGCVAQGYGSGWKVSAQINEKALNIRNLPFAMSQPPPVTMLDNVNYKLPLQECDLLGTDVEHLHAPASTWRTANEKEKRTPP